MNVPAKPRQFNPRQAFHSMWEFCYQNLVLQRGASGAFQVEKMNLRMSQKLKTRHSILGLLVLEAHVTCSRHQEDVLRRVMHGVKDMCLHTSRLPHKHLSRCPRPTTPPHWATTQWGRNKTYACIGNCGCLSEWNRQSAVMESTLAWCLYSVALLIPGCSPLSWKMGVWFSDLQMARAGLGSPEGHKNPNSSRILLNLVLTNVLILKIYLYTVLKRQI